MDDMNFCSQAVIKLVPSGVTLSECSRPGAENPHFS
jgi:hypothetical protein